MRDKKMVLCVILSIMMLVMSGFVAGASAQTKPDKEAWANEELTVDFVYQRRNLALVVPTGQTFRVDKLNDAWGFNIGYNHFFGSGGKRGMFGIGTEGGMTFHDVNNSTVAMAKGGFTATIQANKAKKFQPFVQGRVGVSRENLKENVVCQNSGGGIGLCSPEWSPYYGGSAGFAIPFKADGRQKFRIGCGYFQTRFRNTSQHNGECFAGFSF